MVQTRSSTTGSSESNTIVIGGRGGGIANSIIVPTYKECNNLTPLTERLYAALEKAGLAKETELIVVDDNSRDGSGEEKMLLACSTFDI
jgi:hypothetical protein